MTLAAARFALASGSTGLAAALATVEALRALEGVKGVSSYMTLLIHSMFFEQAAQPD